MLYTEPYQVFIPVKNEERKSEWLQSDAAKIFTDLSAKTNVIVGADSMFDVFQQIKDSVSGMSDDAICIFAHDDAYLLNSADYLVQLFETMFAEESTGFVGVAGCKRLKNSACWWDGLGKVNPNNPTENNNLLGSIYHGADILHMHPTYYGFCGRAQVMDGVFLAFTKRTLDKLQLEMPNYFTGKWDFYDIYYTFQADAHGLQNYVAPISILHESVGDGALQDGWRENREAFVTKFGKWLV